MMLSGLTTLRVGGEARHIVAPATAAELINAVRDVWADGEELLLLGGGSNVVIGDDGFDGTVVRVVTRGIERIDAGSAGEADVAHSGTPVVLRVQAGESWDALVAHTVANGWAGIEALSGIPGSCGAAPIQNIGAYGQEIGYSLLAIEFLDYLTGEVSSIAAGDLGLDYRTSVLKQGREGLVVSIDIALRENGDGLGEPVAFAQLASALGVSVGDRVPVALVRDTVLRLRAGKGMLLDDNDPDSVSAGSFFTNPIVSENFARRLPADAPRWAVEDEPQAAVLPLGEDFALGDGPSAPGARRAQEYRVKLSAAWLIEHAGIRRGFSLPGSGAAVSSKHTLALVNTGGATAAQISELARFIQTRVLAEFGVRLHPEPVFVALQL